MGPVNNISFPEHNRPERTEQTTRVDQQRVEDHSQAQEIVRGQDQASISVQAQQVSELRAEVSQVPEIRQDRVEALQRAIQEGRFNVTNEQIAEALLSDQLGRNS